MGLRLFLMGIYKNILFFKFVNFFFIFWRKVCLFLIFVNRLLGLMKFRSLFVLILLKLGNLILFKFLLIKWYIFGLIWVFIIKYICLLLINIRLFNIFKLNFDLIFFKRCFFI